MMRIQLRGNCQYCGSVQAVVKGKMAKHGYTVEEGWFNGVCPGDRYMPMQNEITFTLALVEQVRNDVAVLKLNAERLSSNEINPATVVLGFGKNARKVPWNEATLYDQILQRKSDISKAEGRARQGEFFIQEMTALAYAMHGKPLFEVEIITTKPAPIVIGEKRKGSTGILTVCSIKGARIYWKNEGGHVGWDGIAKWRKRELAI